MTVALLAESAGDPIDLLGSVDQLIERRHVEADEFYGALAQATAGKAERRIQRQALAGAP